MKIKSDNAFTFDDVLLEPQYSEVITRSDVNLNSRLSKRIEVGSPLIAANMDSISSVNMAIALNDVGGICPIHRFMPPEAQVAAVEQLRDTGIDIIAGTIGVNGDSKERLDAMLSVKRSKSSNERVMKAVFIDIAHGHSKSMIETLEYCVDAYPDVDFIPGNVATKQAVFDLQKAGAAAIKVGIGGGCFAAGTRVLMGDGFYKNIENINNGDRVINMHGESVWVNKAWKTGRRDVLEVKTSSSPLSTYVTPDHRYFVGDLSTISKSTLQAKGYASVLSQESKTIPKKSKIDWMEIGDERDKCTLSPVNLNLDIEDNFDINLTNSTGKKVKLTATYGVGYMFGTFLGDGCSQFREDKSGTVTWYFGSGEERVYRKLENIIWSLGLNCDSKPSFEENMVILKTHFNELAWFFSRFGKKENKSLPKDLLVSNREYLQGLFDGLVDSDGYTENGDGRVCFTNTSLKLVELFNVICVLLNGYWPNSRNEVGTAGGLKGVKDSDCKTVFNSRINKTADKRVLDDFFISKVLYIGDELEETDVYDIEVDCDTHSFIANNVIVHNSMCSTRSATGAGVPQLYAIQECARAANVPIIADGGIKTSGDIVKALVFGADTVMIGSLFAGTKEAAGDLINVNGSKFKVFRGMASRDAQIHWKGVSARAAYEEGISSLVPYKGKVKDTIASLTNGIRSGFSYCGAFNVEELRERAVVQFISGSTLMENSTRVSFRG